MVLRTHNRHTFIAKAIDTTIYTIILLTQRALMKHINLKNIIFFHPSSWFVLLHFWLGFSSSAITYKSLCKACGLLLFLFNPHTHANICTNMIKNTKRSTKKFISSVSRRAKEKIHYPHSVNQREKLKCVN